MNLTAHMQAMLYASTAHVTQETAQALNAALKRKRGALWHSLTFIPFMDTGWAFYVSGDQVAAARESNQPELAALLALALAQGADWLRLDACAPELEGLPTFEWHGAETDHTPA